MKIGFIGMGNMGSALMKGMLKKLPAEDLMFSCKTEEKRIRVSKETGVKAASNTEVAAECGLVILAVKPQIYAEVFEEIKGSVIPGSVYVSLAPGKTIAYVKEALGGNVNVVRAMPNTPALIGCGMTGVCWEDGSLSAEQERCVSELFSSVGESVRVSEDAMSAVVCASGSSPAYVYMFIDALAKAAASKGLEYSAALKLAAGAAAGAAQMVLKSGEDPDVLRKRVCSKGGTTIEGVNKLKECGFEEAIFQATDACFKRSEELAK